jgi:hypothetical protein
VYSLRIEGKLSPKILIVKPEARLSWEYHNRRAEIWQIYKEYAGIIRSNTDTENGVKVYNEGDQIALQQGERHCLIGLDYYCVVASGNIPMLIFLLMKEILLECEMILGDKKIK